MIAACRLTGSETTWLTVNVAGSKNDAMSGVGTARTSDAGAYSKAGRLGFTTGLPAATQASKPPQMDLTCR